MEDRQFYIGVKALITDKEGRILILRKVPTLPSHKWKPFWDLPGGKIQGQGIRETLVREIKEEVGVDRIRIGELFEAAPANFKINGGKDSLMFLIYRCTIPEGARLTLSEEHDKYRWVTRDEAREMLAYELPVESLERL